MADPLQGTGVPRPFDRSLLEATLADAARAVESEDLPEEEPAVAAAPQVARPVVAAAPVTRTPVAGTPVPGTPVPGTPVPGGSSAAGAAPAGAPAPGRLVAPGAQALLSSVATPPDERAIDAGRLRVGGRFGVAGAPAPGGAPGEVSLAPAGARPSVATPALRVAEPGHDPAGDAPPATLRPRPQATKTVPPGLRAPKPGSRPAAAEERPPVRPWQPSDDDILPAGSGGRRRLRLRRG